MFVVEVVWIVFSSIDFGIVFLYDYEDLFCKLFIWKEFKEVCNMCFLFYIFFGFYGGVMYFGFEVYIFKGCVLWILKYVEVDYVVIKFVDSFFKIEYEKFDGEIMFDILMSVFWIGINYEED